MAVFGAAIAAAIISTVVEIVLWACFTDALPGILWRDGRLAAAIVLGPRVLQPAATFDASVMLVASIVHGALSIVYALALAMVVRRLPFAQALIAGILFGLALYAINLHGFTAVFPWFVVARDGITLTGHLAFGLCASATYWLLRRRFTQDIAQP